jgi:hypothetical protein
LSAVDEGHRPTTAQYGTGSLRRPVHPRVSAVIDRFGSEAELRAWYPIA